MLVYSFHYLTILLKHNKRLEYIQLIYCQALVQHHLTFPDPNQTLISSLQFKKVAWWWEVGQPRLVTVDYESGSYCISANHCVMKCQKMFTKGGPIFTKNNP